VIVSLPASVARDVSQVRYNWASYSIDNSITVDLHEPSVTINQGSSQSDPTSDMVMLFDVVFDQSVTGFIGNNASIINHGDAVIINVVITGGPSTYVVSVYGLMGG
jgi:predicted nicotinamide N-methyase